MSGKVVIYEPLYHRDQKVSDVALRALDWHENPLPDWREFAIFVDMYIKQYFRSARMTGLFSPKFSIKTGIPPIEFLDFARRHSDSDVCFINPFPQIPYFSFNVWMQGEVAHPGLTRRAQDLLASSKIDWNLEKVPRQSSDVVCYSNFWVGSPRFWKDYVGLVLVPIASFLKNNPQSPVARAVLEPTSHTDPAPYLPFIVERLFSTFLSLNAQISRTAWQFTRTETHSLCVNRYEKILFDSMYQHITDADKLNIFPDVIKDEMQVKCALWQEQFWTYFANHEHPHTGRTIDLVPPISTKI